MGPAHREALAALRWGLDEPAGFTMLTGAIGTGKTTLIHALLASASERVRIAYVSNPRLSFNEMLALIVSQIGAEPVSGGRLALLEAIGRIARANRVAIVFDEAQQLSDHALEDLRLLSQPQGREPYQVQILLVGQPELMRRLSEHHLRPINQRIAARASLTALSAAQTREYLEFRVRNAGGEPERILTPDAVRSLAARSRGIPRRIDVLGRNAMMIAYARGADRVQAGHVAEAADEYDGGHAAGTHWGLRAAGASAAIGLFAGAAMLLLPMRLSRPSPGAGGTARSASQVHTPTESAHSAQTFAADASPDHGLMDNKAGNWSLLEEAVRRSLRPSAVLRGVSGEDWVGASASGDGGEVIVREGDTLADIARRHLGPDLESGVKLLIAANPEIENADLIYPGQKIRLSQK